MAQVREIKLIDDIDGGEATETVRFGLDGKHYEIDLSDSNAKDLRGALAGFIESARRDTASAGRGRSGQAAQVRRAGADREQNQIIREWGVAQGMKVSDRGRIPSEVLEAYQQANG